MFDICLDRRIIGINKGDMNMQYKFYAKDRYTNECVAFVYQGSMSSDLDCTRENIADFAKSFGLQGKHVLVILDTGFAFTFQDLGM